MSSNLSFIFDCPIIYKTVKYIDKSDNNSQCAVDFNTTRFGRLIADWSVENMSIYLPHTGCR